jgi:sulfopyruvate decarboxylase TPP-binding subunit
MATSSAPGTRSPKQVAGAIADTLVGADATLVASLPDNWIAPLIAQLDSDHRFRHVPVNREESAVGLCSGAFFGGKPTVALMGASGFLTCIYAITKINFTYQIPIVFMITLRGDPGDDARYHVSNGLYLRSVIQAINLPAVYVTRFEELPLIGDACRHASVLGRPYVVGLSRDLLKGIR